MNDKGMIAPYLASSLLNLFTPENKSQFRLKKDLNSTRMNDFLINGGIPVSIYDNMLTFRVSNRSFKLDGDLLETITNHDFYVNLSNPQDRKLKHEFGKETNFDKKQKRPKKDRGKSLIKSLKSPAILASGVPTIFWIQSFGGSNRNRLKLLLQEKQFGNNSNIIYDEIVAIVDKLLEYKCISKKEHKQFSIECSLLHK